jgi:hypothetical protein
MSRRDSRSRHRTGAIPEVERDNSVTLYGIEDWTQVRDDPVVRIVLRTGAETGAVPEEPDAGSATDEGHLNP